jgi:hypothetical protein
LWTAIGNGLVTGGMLRHILDKVSDPWRLAGL